MEMDVPSTDIWPMYSLATTWGSSMSSVTRWNGPHGNFSPRNASLHSARVRVANAASSASTQACRFSALAFMELKRSSATSSGHPTARHTAGQ